MKSPNHTPNREVITSYAYIAPRGRDETGLLKKNLRFVAGLNGEKLKGGKILPASTATCGLPEGAVWDREKHRALLGRQRKESSGIPEGSKTKTTPYVPSRDQQETR